MENAQQNQDDRNPDSELTSCEHTENCCVVPPSITIKFGKRWASALAGLVAGVAIASIVLVPWMAFQGILCSEAQYQRVQPPAGEDIAPLPIEAVPEAPSVPLN